MKNENKIPQLISVMKTELIFNLIILFHHNPEFVLLKFKDEAEAKKTLKQIKEAKSIKETISIWDDRSSATIDGREIKTVSIEEVGA